MRHQWQCHTGIRESDLGTGPTGAGDGNADTIGDSTFSPLGAPASNLQGPNFTPPFPSYPSGHAGFGGALFQTLRRFYGTDDIAFTFVSDEFNGVTQDSQGNVRPLRSRSFSSLSVKKSLGKSKGKNSNSLRPFSSILVDEPERAAARAMLYPVGFFKDEGSRSSSSELPRRKATSRRYFTFSTTSISTFSRLNTSSRPSCSLNALLMKSRLAC